MGTSDFDAHSVGRLEHIRQSVLRRIAYRSQNTEVGDDVPQTAGTSPADQNIDIALILLSFF